MSDDSYYCTALVCENGHVITDVLRDSNAASHCERCGAPTLSRCRECNAPIHGHYVVPMALTFASEYELPAFCYGCGHGYPWTLAREAAAKELVTELDGLDDSEKAILSQSISELVRESPEAEVAGLRFKKLAKKAGVEATGALRNILVDVMSEAVRKSVFGPS